MLRWTHAHTGLAGALAGLWFAHSPVLVILVVVGVAFTVGLLAGRFWAGLHRARKAVAAELTARAKELERKAALQRAALRERQARARLAEAKARDGKAIAAESRRRADRARGITNSEIAQLQMGRGGR